MPHLTVDRRDFLRLGAAGLATALAPGARAATGPVPRPNVLFIWTDQLTRSALSSAGNAHLRTPAIDSIAAAGVAFDCAYSCNPICVPSRTSWITAQYSHRTTVSFNTPEHPITVPPVSRLFKAAGYDTGYVGKWHIPHAADDAAWHGFDYVRAARANRLDPEVPGACVEFLRRPRTQPFFLVASFVDPHDICEGARIEAGLKETYKNGSVPPPPPPDQCPPLPANTAIPAGEPEVIRQLKALAPTTYPTAGWSDGQWRQYLWTYYRLIEKVDARIGQILAALKETGQDDNTVIVFASDHGDGAAAHQWNQKTLFYEEVVGVPFIVRPPRCARPGSRDRSTLVSMNLDFFPTVFDYAGITPPEGLPGKSLRPLITSPTSSDGLGSVRARANALSEEQSSKSNGHDTLQGFGLGPRTATGHPYLIAQNDLAPQAGRSGGIYGRMIRSPRYKYIRYSAGARREQFFDLDQDPGELRDLTLAATPPPELAAHRAELDRWMAENGDPFPHPISSADLTARARGAD